MARLEGFLGGDRLRFNFQTVNSKLQNDKLYDAVGRLVTPPPSQPREPVPTRVILFFSFD